MSNEKPLRPAPPDKQGEPLKIGPEGLPLFLDLELDCELETGDLYLSSAEDVKTEDDKPLNISVTSDRGIVDGSEEKKVNWLLIDWGINCVVAGLEIKAEAIPESTPTFKARVKVSQNNIWVPLTPTDMLTVGSKQSISPAATSKLMIEFVAELETSDPAGKSVKIPGAWSPVTVPVKERPRVYFSSAPGDLDLAVGDTEPFFSYQGILPFGKGIPAEGFKAAVNSFLKQSGITEIPLMLRAAIPGWITAPKIEKFSVVYIRTKWEGGDIDENGRLELPWQGEAIASTEIGENARVREVQFQLEVDLLHERLHVAPKKIESSKAQLCDARYAATQGFKALPGSVVLNGIDLFLRPVRLPVKGELVIYPDDMGRPARLPYPDAGVDIDLQDDSKGLSQDQWVVCQFSQPLTLGTNPWWAVLTLESGELHWYRGSNRSPEVLESMYRIGRGPWVDQAGPLWNLARLRVNEEKPTGVELFLRRGKAEINLTPDDRRQVRLLNGALEDLNEKKTAKQKELKLVVRSETAGTVTITKPHIKFIPGNSG
jgi:hypothetical protein